MCPRDRAKRRTQERILDAAERVFAEKGYHQTLVDEIARTSRTSKGAVYFHFPSKEALFAALMDRLAARLLREVEGAIAAERGGVAKVRAALEAVTRRLARHRRLAKVLLVQSFSSPAFVRKRLEVLERFAGLVRAQLDDAIAEGSIAPVDTAVVAHAWLGAVHELVVRWLYTGEPPLERAVPELTALLLRSVGLEPASEPERPSSTKTREQKREQS